MCNWIQQWLCHSDDEPHNPETELNSYTTLYTVVYVPLFHTQDTE
jgi:hypothetical protein